MAVSRPISSLLADLDADGPHLASAQALRFSGVDGRDVYNVSGTFTDGLLPDALTASRERKPLIVGRVEERSSEDSTAVVFSQGDDEVWRPLAGAAALPLQDPFVFTHADHRYVGGVEVGVDDGRVVWRTKIFTFDDLRAPELVFTGPWGMKDIRFVDLGPTRLAVFTRPQGGEDGPGRIGFLNTESLDSLTNEALEQAPRLEGLFAPGEWGGANCAHLRPDGSVGVLGHIARMDRDGTRHYYPMAFQVEPQTLKATAPRLLFRRSDLPAGESKRPDLADVIFPGAVETDGSLARIYCGAGDAEAYVVELADPLF